MLSDNQCLGDMCHFDEGHYAFAKIEPFWQVHGK